MSFSRALVQSERQIASARILTQVIDYISYDKHHIKYTSDSTRISFSFVIDCWVQYSDLNKKKKIKKLNAQVKESETPHNRKKNQVLGFRMLFHGTIE